MTEWQLHCLLSSKQEIDEHRLNEWLQSTPPVKAGELLLAVCEHHKRNVLIGTFPLVFISIVNLIPSIKVLVFPTSLVIPIVYIIALLCQVAIVGREANAIPKAVLLLAHGNDKRAIPHLIRLWRRKTYGLDALIQNEKVEEELTRLLSRFTRKATSNQDGVGKSVRMLAQRIIRQRADFSEQRTDLLIAALRFLHATGDEENLAVVRFVAVWPVKGTNQALARETARFLLDPAQTDEVPPSIAMHTKTDVAKVLTVGRRQ